MSQENQRASELTHSEKVGGMVFRAAAEQGNSLIELADHCIFLTRTTCP
jgi:hypothetical protein